MVDAAPGLAHVEHETDREYGDCAAKTSTPRLGARVNLIPTLEPALTVLTVGELAIGCWNPTHAYGAAAANCQRLACVVSAAMEMSPSVRVDRSSTHGS